MDSPLENWPEPVVPVQSIAESGAQQIPFNYIKPASDRPTFAKTKLNIPIIDIGKLNSGSGPDCRAVIRAISDACRDWGFFQVVNHEVDLKLIKDVMGVWEKYFNLPLEEKKKLANSPRTYEGYGSRLGVEKGVALDWGDYFFLNFLPECIRNIHNWPTEPSNCREMTEEYGRQMVNLCETIMKVLSISLGYDVGFLKEKFGGEEIGSCIRVNYYPKCPQPELTFGLSAHSDPGGLTVLLADDQVPGLQVRKGNSWVSVKPISGALIVNVGDQIQVLSNAIYKSVEHRVVANATEKRLSIAFFYNPKSDLLLEPLRELVTQERPQLYRAMTFNEYRLYIRKNGPKGKTQVESLEAM